MAQPPLEKIVPYAYGDYTVVYVFSDRMKKQKKLWEHKKRVP